MDQNLRNKLRNVVTQCRRLLEDAVAQVLQGQFGIHATGKKEEVQVEDAARMGHLSQEDRQYREQVLVHLDHIQATGFKLQAKPTKPALDQLIREIAFTHLNRLCAYKMMECRGLIREAVSRGVKSQGFLFYLADHDQDEKLHNAGHQDVAYRHFLNWLGGSLSEEIGVLFSPHDSANRLFPPQRVLDDVLGLLNSDELKDIWTEDEAIGWVYQYFTPKELRDEARKASAVPRNSYELAFRNQFFTPRYVVEFLTDNTLGRIWYEMREGDTALKDRCRYLVRRPNEVFLGEGEAAPPTKDTNEADLSQEELLKQAGYIPHRPKKDPREIRVLDPACGSGHFLLYCFDLFLVIYEEAYADPDLRPALQKDYATLDDLRRALPGLILSRNLHGIDIDLRATQIAALALWLLSQRTYQDMGIKKDRPKITRSNIVCAEPMPGEKNLLDAFLKTLREDKLEALLRRAMQVPGDKRIRATAAMADRLCELVELVWDNMQLAGEAGSLLKIEEELQEAIRQGQQEFEEKNPLFRVTEYGLDEDPPEHYYRFVPGDVEGERVSFWDMAERLVLEALQDYAAYAANGNRLQRHLFVEDAARGFAFVDLCRQRFDVLLMNPPYGDFTSGTLLFAKGSYAGFSANVYGCFWKRACELCIGLIGALTSRTFLTLGQFEPTRKLLLSSDSCLNLVADLGPGVLDEAAVDTSASTVSCNGHQTDAILFFRLDNDLPNRATNLASASLSVSSRSTKLASCGFLRDPKLFLRLPGYRMMYWASSTIIKLFDSASSLEGDLADVRAGLYSGDDFRFTTLWWETPCTRERRRRWFTFAKGGEYERYYADLPFLINWQDDGREVKAYALEKAGSVSKFVYNEAYYCHPGITFPNSSAIGFSARVLPSGSIPSVKGQGVYPRKPHSLEYILALLNSRLAHSLLSLFNPGKDAQAGDVKILPFRVASKELVSSIRDVVKDIIANIRCVHAIDETSPAFVCPRSSAPNSLAHSPASLSQHLELLSVVADHIDKQEDTIERLVCQALGADRDSVEELLARSDPRPLAKDFLTHALADLFTETSGAAVWVSFAFGCALGRWDARFATSKLKLPRLPDPFDPLPICSPGMLTDPDGLPASDAPPDYPIRIEWDGIMVDDPDHASDVVRRVREVLELIWKDRADAIEKEVCDTLGVKELRDYFRKPGGGGFWDDHVKRYSKSRR
jgi:hypothetical protein